MMNATSTAPPSLDTLDNELPKPPQPVGSYVTAVRVDNLLFTSGVLPMQEGQLVYKGTVGSIPVGLEEGQAAAKLCILNALSIVKQQLGSLHRVQRIVKLTGYVNSKSDFKDHPQVINAASNFLGEIFGEMGHHARCAVGVSSLPLGACVELDLVVQVKPD